MRRFRGRWIVVALLVAAGLFFAVDIISLQHLESRGAAELARTMAAEEAKLDLGGVPFLPGFITGHLRRGEVKVRGASGGGGLRIQSFTSRMESIGFSPRRLLSLSRSAFATRTTVRAAEAFGLMEIGQDDLEEFIRQQIPLVGDVRVAASGIEVRFLKKRLERGAQPSDEDLTEPARLLPRVADRRFVLTLVGSSGIPEPLQRAARRLEGLVKLPQIPEGLRTDVRLGDGVVVVEATGR
ncbi:MAG TPA: DUF2993 domain-containing protein, partial [Actinomycetota bacterium]|nr:DUF2993 domain-containing protein [Actinomycetota bacterium]